VEQFMGNLLELNQFKADFTGDEIYCCIGTTKEKTPEKTLYKKIDHGIPVAAAKLAKANGIDSFLVISAMGADAGSSTFYTKTKGEMERDVLEQNLKNTYILRPSLIEGDRDEDRTFEKIGLSLMKIVQPLFVGKLKQYKTIRADTIAKAMIHLANTKGRSKTIITSDEIKVLANKN
ncbi:MAG: nucleoside-diphosphate sugar epimerase, partial [Pricia sp.]